MILHQADQMPLDLSAELETGHYLVPHKWGFFSVLQKHKGQRAKQSSYMLRDLPTVLPLLQSPSQRNRDNWITQAVFRQANRRKVNLAHVGTCFVDLDYYQAGLDALHPLAVLNRVLKHCEAVRVPFPSLVIDSGRGLQLKWYHDPLPRAALPRWDAVQTHLCKYFSELGADKNARDASRVLRVVQTINQKNNKAVKVIWQLPEGFEGHAKHYCFDDLANAVLPVNREELPRKESVSKKGKGKKAGVVNIHSRIGKSLNSLNWSRMEDILKLNEIRGGFSDGMRELACFWTCNFYALRYAKELAERQLSLSGEYHEFASLCRQIAPHWDMERIRDKTSNLYPLLQKHAKGETVEFQGRQYPPLYTPDSQYLIDRFEITDAEQRQLITIHSKELHKERERDRKREARRKSGAVDREEYEKQARERTKIVLQLKSQGFKYAYIGEKLGISEAAVKGVVKRAKASGIKA